MSRQSPKRWIKIPTTGLSWTYQWKFNRTFRIPSSRSRHSPGMKPIHPARQDSKEDETSSKTKRGAAIRSANCLPMPRKIVSFFETSGANCVNTEVTTKLNIHFMMRLPLITFICSSPHPTTSSAKCGWSKQARSVKRIGSTPMSKKNGPPKRVLSRDYQSQLRLQDEFSSTNKTRLTFTPRLKR